MKVYYREFEDLTSLNEFIKDRKIEKNIISLNYIEDFHCMDFKQDDHYCGIYHAEQTLILVKDVYKFKKENLDE